MSAFVDGLPAQLSSAVRTFFVPCPPNQARTVTGRYPDSEPVEPNQPVADAWDAGPEDRGPERAAPHIVQNEAGHPSHFLTQPTGVSPIGLSTAVRYVSTMEAQLSRVQRGRNDEMSGGSWRGNG